MRTRLVTAREGDGFDQRIEANWAFEKDLLADLRHFVI